jgi:hypothetical protein
MQIYETKIKDSRYTGSAFVIGGSRCRGPPVPRALAGAGSGRGKRLRAKKHLAGYHPRTKGASMAGGKGKGKANALRKLVRQKMNERLKGSAIVGGRKYDLEGGMYGSSVIGGARPSSKNRRPRTHRARPKVRSRAKHSGGRKPSAWNLFFKRFYAQNKHKMSAQEAMKKAAVAYRSSK